MALYGVFQAGSNPDMSKNLSSVCIGDTYILFDGTETPEAGLKSVAFARATQGSSDNGCTFYASGMPPDAVVSIQGSNEDIDANYVTLADITPDAAGNGAYTDVGRPPFYRAILSTWGGASPESMPRVTVER